MVKYLKDELNKVRFESFSAFWAVVFLSLVIYFQQSWVPGFFQDGYLYSVLGKNAAELGNWLVPFQSETQYPKFDQHPPTLFMIEGVFFKLFGFSYSSARVFSGLWSLASVVFLFYFLTKVKNYKWAFFSCLILILCPSLMKKTRFPGLDVPLMLSFAVSLGSYYLAVFKGHKKLWIVCGVFAGLGLLIKGFPALLIALIIFLHLIFTKRLSELKSLLPWASLFLGLFLFGLWPLALYLSGDLQVFKDYINVQFFSTMVEGRGVQKVDYLLYVVHLLKTCGPWVVLSVLAGRIALKNEDKPLFLLFLVWFASVLIPLSFLKFKYSHYIMPLYPALAGMAGYYLTQISDKAQNRIFRTFKILIPAAALVLLIFPVTTKTKRHKETFKVLEVLRLHNLSPKTWYIVDESYGYWSTSSLSSLEMKANPRAISYNDLINLSEIKNSLYFVSKERFISNKETLFGKGFRKLLEVERFNIVVLLGEEIPDMVIR